MAGGRVSLCGVEYPCELIRIEPGAAVTADTAGTRGDGGEVTLHARVVHHYGATTSRGGLLSGDGG